MTGWMTAELFVKLAAKLYSERKPMLDSSDDDLSSQDSGGALVDLRTPPSKNSAALPYQFRELQHDAGNPFALLAQLEDDQADETLDFETSSSGQQWLPHIESRFWDLYRNRLRVNAIEGGVCDLEGRD